MFYRADKTGKIIDSADFKYAEDCIETDKKIVVGFDGSLRFEEETFSEDYISKKNEYENKTEKIKQIQKLEKWFDNYFDKQLKQSLWQEDFKPSYDSLLGRQYENINELKKQAQEIRETIKELRLELV